jgi:type III pantothenate kinase
LKAPRDGLLLVDLGNRRAKWALADGTVFARTTLDPARTESAVSALRSDGARAAACTRVRFACVAPRWRAGLLDALPPRALAHEVLPGDVPLTVRSRGTGVDRLLGAWWAHRRTGGAALVASLGTAFTLDAVDAQGVFHGGAIGPGLGVQEAALAAAAPHLPPPDPAWHPGAIPDHSAAAIACGTRGALAAALQGLARDFTIGLGAPGCARFLTGGDAARVAPLLGPGWEWAPDLVVAALAALAAEREW